MRVQGSGFRVEGFKNKGVFRVEFFLRFRAQASGSGVRVQGVGFEVWVEGFGSGCVVRVLSYVHEAGGARHGFLPPVQTVLSHCLDLYHKSPDFNERRYK